MDLSLVPIEDLLKEVENRCEYFLFACRIIHDGRMDTDTVWAGDPDEIIRLVELLGENVGEWICGEDNLPEGDKDDKGI